MPRLFSGIEIPEAIGHRMSLLRTGLSGARWIDPANYHITLRFIGDVDGGTARDFAANLGHIEAEPFQLQFDGIGSFVFFGESHGFEFTWWLGILSAVMAVGSFAFAWTVYLKGGISLENTKARLAPVLKVVENKYYFDEVYQWVVDRVVLVFARIIAWFDRAVVNDIVVNTPANSVRLLGLTLRFHITGHVYSYTLAMVLGFVGLGIFWWLRST